MKRVYSTPVVEFEAYSLTSQIAGACADAGKIPVGDVSPIMIEGTQVHCVVKDTNAPKNCSPGAHTWTVQLDGTIFADGNKEGGCTHDVYSQAEYARLLASTFTGGSNISGGLSPDGKYYYFKGNSPNHTGSFEVADYSNYFQS